MDETNERSGESIWFLYPLLLVLFLVIVFIALANRGGDDTPEQPPTRVLEGVVTEVQPASQGSQTITIMTDKATVTVNTPTKETAAKLSCVEVPGVEKLGGATVKFNLPLSQDAMSSEPSAEVYNTCWDPSWDQTYYFTITKERAAP